MLMQPTGLDTGQRSRKLILLMFYRGLFLLLQVFLIAVMIAPILTNSASPWWFDNLLGLQWQWGILAMLSFVAGLRFLPAITLWLLPVYAILLLVNFAELYVPTELTNQSSTDFSIAQLNMRYDNPNAMAIFSGLLEANHDLIIIQEVSDRQAALLESLRHRYPYAMGSMSVSSHSPGHVLLSKWPLRKRRIHNLGYADGSVIDTEFVPGGQGPAVRILALHPAAPRTRALWQLRNSTFAFIAREVGRSQLSRQVVVGDLNATPWSAAFRQLLRDAEISGNGDGYLPTWSWFNRLPVLGLLTSAYIDHCLVTSGLVVSDKHSRIVPGSDHRLVVTRLQLD
jgi:endonuclease/exonuclease/phosphatase (EEP) superfamily protein YafD